VAFSHIDREFYCYVRICLEPLSEIEAKIASPLASIRAHISKIIFEVQGQAYYKYHHAFSPGMQEYIEAVSFLHFLQTGELITLQKIEKDILDAHSSKDVTFFVAPRDYLLGICDLTGELMRLCLNASKEQTICHNVLLFLRHIYEYMTLLPFFDGNMWEKLSVMKASLDKVENAYFQLTIRGAEYPKELFVPLLEETTKDDAVDNDED
jgi:predicted translin family RNA/ssDNA-binding protein